MRSKGRPASVSNTAGTFVCNYSMYCLLYYIDQRYLRTRGGSIHVPYVTNQVTEKADTPSMSLADIVTALEAAAEAIVTTTEDIWAVGGETH